MAESPCISKSHSHAEISRSAQKDTKRSRQGNGSKIIALRDNSGNKQALACMLAGLGREAPAVAGCGVADVETNAWAGPRRHESGFRACLATRSA
jgi:hypothetical protein